MESTIQTFVASFIKASKGRENIPEKGFQKLLKNQLQNIIAETDSAAAVKEYREGLDGKLEDKVSFKEFMDVIGFVATRLSKKQLDSKETPAPETEAD